MPNQIRGRVLTALDSLHEEWPEALWCFSDFDGCASGEDGCGNAHLRAVLLRRGRCCGGKHSARSGSACMLMNLPLHQNRAPFILSSYHRLSLLPWVLQVQRGHSWRPRSVRGSHLIHLQDVPLQRVRQQLLLKFCRSQLYNLGPSRPTLTDWQPQRGKSTLAPTVCVNQSLPNAFLVKFAIARPSQGQDWKLLCPLIHQSLQRGDSVLLHCMAGRHRAAAVTALGYVRTSVDQAASEVTALRPNVQFHKFCRDRGEAAAWLHQTRRATA